MISLPRSLKQSYLPPLNSDADYEEDAGIVRKVAAALGKWENEVGDSAVETKVERESEKVGEEEENIGQTEERLKVVEYIRHGPEIFNIDYPFQIKMISSYFFDSTTRLALFPSKPTTQVTEDTRPSMHHLRVTWGKVVQVLYG